MYKGTGPARGCVDCALPPTQVGWESCDITDFPVTAENNLKHVPVFCPPCLTQDTDGSTNIPLGIKLLAGNRKVGQLENVLPQWRNLGIVYCCLLLDYLVESLKRYETSRSLSSCLLWKVAYNLFSFYLRLSGLGKAFANGLYNFNRWLTLHKIYLEKSLKKYSLWIG